MIYCSRESSAIDSSIRLKVLLLCMNQRHLMIYFCQHNILLIKLIIAGTSSTALNASYQRMSIFNYFFGELNCQPIRYGLLQILCANHILRGAKIINKIFFFLLKRLINESINISFTNCVPCQ